MTDEKFIAKKQEIFNKTLAFTELTRLYVDWSEENGLPLYKEVIESINNSLYDYTVENLC